MFCPTRTVTLKVASRLASAVSLGAGRGGAGRRAPACHENQDYLNLFSWRSFTQTFPALLRKLVFFTGGSAGSQTCARTLARLTHLIIACTHECAHALKPDAGNGRVFSLADDLNLPGWSGSSRPAGVAASSVCYRHGGGAGGSTSRSVL